jgi:hypothetical protein
VTGIFLSGIRDARDEPNRLFGREMYLNNRDND